MNKRVVRKIRRCGLWLVPASLLLALALWLADTLWPLPLREVYPARVVVAEDGTPLWRFADENGIWRYPVKPEEVSSRYLEALIQYEDRFFWRHPGINPFAIVRAAYQYLRSGTIISGGSTLTMQVARLLDPHPRTAGGKLRQVWRALQLEWHLSKREILTLYLNRAPFGGTLQGVGAASWTYLGKSPENLSYSEAALLAVLPQAPSRLRPDRWPERAEAARNKILRRMAAQGKWDAGQVSESIEEPIWLAPRQMPHLAPLFSRYLARHSKKTRIQSTLDASLQRQLEEFARVWKTHLTPGSSVAVLVVDHTTMKVRAWVGSVDISDNSRFGHVDMVTAIRSPGSVLKPFIYGLAMDEGLIHPASLLQDVPRRFGDYRPGNFDSGFTGPVSTSDALIRSLNLPAVQVLEAYGPRRFAGVLRNAGLPLIFPAGAEPNLSLILGGAGARLADITAAYSVFARHGRSAALRLTPDDPLVERPVMSQGAAWIIRRILANGAQPMPDNALPRVVPLAWKTGTSYGYRDAWAIGVNARYLIGVWTGRPDGTPVAGQFGYASAIPLLNQVNNLLDGAEYTAHTRIPEDPRPDSVSASAVCWPGGQWLAKGDPNCRRRLSTWLLDHSQPPTLLAAGQEGVRGTRISLWLNNKGERVAPDCPNVKAQTLLLWPLSVEPWLPVEERRAARLPEKASQCPPLSEVDVPPLLLTSVSDGAVLKRLPGHNYLSLKLLSQGGQGERWWFLDGEPLDIGSSDASVTLDRAGKYQLVVMDGAGQVATANFTVL